MEKTSQEKKREQSSLWKKTGRRALGKCSQSIFHTITLLIYCAAYTYSKEEMESSSNIPPF